MASGSGSNLREPNSPSPCDSGYLKEVGPRLRASDARLQAWWGPHQAMAAGSSFRAAIHRCSTQRPHRRASKAQNLGLSRTTRAHSRNSMAQQRNDVVASSRVLIARVLTVKA